MLCVGHSSGHAQDKQPCVQSGLPGSPQTRRGGPCKPCGSTAEYFSIAVSDPREGKGETIPFSR